MPLLHNLRKILSDNSVMEQIDTFPEHVHSDGLIRDFCDGSLYANNPLFSQDPYALQVIAYFDELEICNPLGSHVKRHKLGIVL